MSFLGDIQGGGLKRTKKKMKKLRHVNVVLGRSTIRVDAKSDDLVKDVVERIRKERPGVDIKDVLFRSIPLIGTKTLASYGIGDGNKIYVKEKLKEKDDTQYWITCGLSAEREAVLMERDMTFKSYFVDIKPTEAEEIVAFYKSWIDGGKNTSFVSSVPKSLSELAKRVDDCIRKHFSSCGAFVKLTTRSPKDSPIAVQACMDALRKSAPQSGELDLNERLATTANAIKSSLHVKSGQEALLHFLYSERIFEDLRDSLSKMKRSDGNSSSSMLEQQIVVREYIHIPIDAEFRAFIWKGKLCAASQYHYHTCFKKVITERDAIAADIQRFFKDFHPIIREPVTDSDGKKLPPLECYTVDIGRLDGGRKMILVEVNPFDGFYGTLEGSTCLFDWTDDRAVLTGLRDFELRIREKPEARDALKKKLRPDWWKMMVATSEGRSETGECATKRGAQ